MAVGANAEACAPHAGVVAITSLEATLPNSCDRARMARRNMGSTMSPQ